MKLEDANQRNFVRPVFLVQICSLARQRVSVINAGDVEKATVDQILCQGSQIFVKFVKNLITEWVGGIWRQDDSTIIVFTPSEKNIACIISTTTTCSDVRETQTVLFKTFIEF